MILQIYFTAIISLFFSTVEPPATVPNIPDQANVLSTQITITPEGKQKIAEKLESLTRNQKYFDDYLNRCLMYFPAIEREFLAAGVPPDFKYLSLQESTLDGNAVSRSQAVGYWQFKAATAEEYQLRIDNAVDERKNVISASRAAAQYFKKSHHYLNNWFYALLSYNLGLTGAKNYIADNNLSNNIVIDGNTHQYITHFLAHYFAFNDVYQAKQNAAPYYLVEYAGGIQNNLAEIAQFVLGPQDPRLNSYVNTLKQYNPWLLNDRVPQNEAYCYSLVLPVPQDMREEVIGKMKPYACGGKARGHSGREFYADSLKNDYPFIVNKQEFKNTDTYREVLANGVRAVMPKKQVKARKVWKDLGISKKEFQAYNEGMKYKKLKQGALYYIEEKSDRIPLSYHIAEKGEELFDLAQKYGIQMAKLHEYNELDEGYELKPGDKVFFNPAEE